MARTPARLQGNFHGDPEQPFGLITWPKFVWFAPRVDHEYEKRQNGGGGEDRVLLETKSNLSEKADK